MAYRRSLSTRATLIARLNSPSISYIPYDHDRTLSQQKNNNFIQPRFFGSSFNDSYGSGGLFPGKRISQFVLGPSAGSAYCRYMSSMVGEGSENIESISDVAEVLKDTTIDAVANQAPALNEVAVAAADSFLPVSALQHFIDIVPNFTGWWASIAVTALLVRSAALPLLVIQHKANSKLGLVSPQVMKIKQQMQEKGMDPEFVAEGQKQMAYRYGVTPFTPLKWLFINGPIFMGSLFVISNMAEKVSSFKNGGAFWLTDLSSPDSFYIFPILIFPILYGFRHINEGIKEIMADYVHQEMTRTWILVCLRLFLLIVIKDVFLFYG